MTKEQEDALLSDSKPAQGYAKLTIRDCIMRRFAKVATPTWEALCQLEAGEISKGKALETIRQEAERMERENWHLLQSENQALIATRDRLAAEVERKEEERKRAVQKAQESYDAWDQLRADLAAEREYIKRLDQVIDDEGVADPCISPLEDLERAIRKLKADLATAKTQLTQRDPGEQANVLNKQLVAELRKELDESKAQAGKAFEDNVALTQAKEQLEKWHEDHLRIMAASDASFREARTTVAHLWRDIDQPGIAGICAKLLETSKELAAAKAQVEEFKAIGAGLQRVNSALQQQLAAITAERDAEREQGENRLGVIRAQDATRLRLRDERDAALSRAETAERRVKVLEEDGKCGYEALQEIKRTADKGPIEVLATDAIWAIDAALAPISTEVISNDSGSGSQAAASLPGPEKSAETRPHHIPEPSEGCASPAVTFLHEGQACPECGGITRERNGVDVEFHSQTCSRLKQLPPRNSPANVRTGGAGEWLPIETAPKDWKEIQGWNKHGWIPRLRHHKRSGWQYEEKGVWWSFSDSSQPTHWQPLPSAPAPQEGGV